jgi:hypothetical protein
MTDATKRLTLLVIDFAVNWYEIFKGATLSDGTKIVVEQTRWKSMNLESCTEEGVSIFCKAESEPFPFSSQKHDRTVKPDFILVRNFPTNLHAPDYGKLVMGLMFASVPSINSLHSVFMCLHRPLIHGEMVRVRNEQIRDKLKQHNIAHSGPINGSTIALLPEAERKFILPPIRMRYHPNQSDEKTPPGMFEKRMEYPQVVKVGTAHVGYGKTFVKSQQEMDDLASILVMNHDFYTTEPMISFEYEYRVQKIGSHYRAFKRESHTSWKQNWGNVVQTDYPLAEHHIAWVEACSKIFGGLNMLAIDVLHTKDGTDYIIEINDTAFGLMYEHEKEDANYIKEEVLDQMNHLFMIK